MFVSCGDPNIPNGGTISGTIADYKAGSIDSLFCYTDDADNLLGSCNVSSTGKFTINVHTPPLVHKYRKIENVIQSDTNAMVSAIVYFKALKNGKVAGYIYKSNITDDSDFEVGKAFSDFYYSDRKFTIKGTTHIAAEHTSLTRVYDLTFNKGWNEVSSQVTEKTQDSESFTQTVVISNKIPTGLEWVLTSE